MTKRLLSIFSSFTVCVWLAPGLFAQSDLKDHDTRQPIDISAERLEVKQKEGTATFTGTVIITQGKMALNADALTVYYDLSGGIDKPSIERLDVRGNVKLTSSTESVSGNWGIYDVTRRLVTIGGDVHLARSTSSLSGDRLELDLVSGLTKMDGLEGSDGRVTGSFSVPDEKTP